VGRRSQDVRLVVRLAWVRPPYNSELRSGEYVEVKNFLGRHTVYKEVEGGAAAEPEDIPSALCSSIHPVRRVVVQAVAGSSPVAHP
jgi:ribosome maturation protein Sdo1